MKTNKWQGAIATPNSIFPLFRQLFFIFVYAVLFVTGHVRNVRNLRPIVVRTFSFFLSPSRFRELSAGNSDGVNFSDEAAKKQQRQRGRKAKNYCRVIPTIVCT